MRPHALDRSTRSGRVPGLASGVVAAGFLLLATWLGTLPPSACAQETPSTPRPDTQPTAETPASQSDSVHAPQNPAAPADLDASLERARELIKAGDNDEAITLLKTSIIEARSHLAKLREAYLLLIKTHVFMGNDLKFRSQGREPSKLSYKAARELIVECLKTEGLRHTQPDPASDPPEMVASFAEVRSQIFGSFRVVDLVPRDAVVLLDSDTLRVAPGDSLPGDVDLLAGPHVVVVLARGHQALTDHAVLSPNATLERSYRLRKNRGARWYATRATGAIGVVGGVVAILAGKGNEPLPVDQPLPVAPPPPTQ